MTQGAMALALVLWTAAAPARAQPGLGMPLAATDLAALPVTVFPDGRGLPPGQGSVPQGQGLYAQHCAACHGDTGREGPRARLVGSDGFWAWNDPLRPLRVLKQPLQVLSVGAQWPYAAPVYDYIWRAMPYQAPKSLAPSEVYAITAYLLHLNGLLAADATLDRNSLPRVRMPGLARTVMAWPQVPWAPVPGARN
ncbi:MAG: hypothetical protein A2W72_07130 [Burkholderiales bacterium RIFCSPLOWO2_12_67_14]|nr:MAG: hypothetical protein A3I64_19560 [Burkholderiales bacterium RIFCSPLOWO2_02_FULL_67_64]OGB41893.1 MAG: hypothetical protein A2W72_07130 [Burkholderiales bacterium RIFCSPLOWO2_12_67_14]OGB46353.1 MAG: hypothetical protein A3E51_23015 [Burkholderiales bacterium RIFCSPHIGHO2_12_FULL_67_38]